MSKEQEHHADELARLARSLNGITESCLSLRAGPVILEQIATLYQASLDYDTAKNDAFRESL